MKNKMNNWQQGDVVGRRVKSVPPQAIKVSTGRCILAEGEATGHHHVVNVPGTEMFRMGANLFLKVVQPSLLTHQEHKPIMLDPGIYEISQVREFDWFSKMERRVID